MWYTGCRPSPPVVVHVVHMGKRTSIYLSGDREQAIEASGRSLLDIIDLGLQALSGGKIVDVGTGEGAPATRSRPTKDDCKHPKARRAKGLCMACGTNVGTA